MSRLPVPSGKDRESRVKRERRTNQRVGGSDTTPQHGNTIPPWHHVDEKRAIHKAHLQRTNHSP
jgi:hypothetical protein